MVDSWWTRGHRLTVDGLGAKSQFLVGWNMVHAGQTVFVVFCFKWQWRRECFDWPDYQICVFTSLQHSPASVSVFGFGLDAGM